MSSCCTDGLQFSGSKYVGWCSCPLGQLRAKYELDATDADRILARVRHYGTLMAVFDRENDGVALLEAKEELAALEREVRCLGVLTNGS